jgi:hypothetical protein
MGQQSNQSLSSYGTISYSRGKCGVMLQRFWEYPYGLDKLVDSVKELGVGWIRIHIPWYYAQPTNKTGYDVDFLGKLDNVVSLARERNLKILAVISGTPNWASGGWNEIYWRPQNLQDFADFVAFCIDRYKSDVKHWQLWNEPDNYWQKGTDEDYVEMIRLAYTAAKDADPECVILLNWGIETSPPENRTHGIVPLYNLGVQNYFDILGIDTYITPPEKYGTVVSGLRDWLVSQGDDNREIWCNEFGFYLGWEGMTLEKQADYTIRTAEILLDNDVTHVFYFCFWSPDEPGWSMVSDENLTPRPVYYAYRDFIKSH